MSATIESLEAQLVDLPTIRPHRLSMTTMNCQTLVIVRLRCSDGIVGIGEATTIGGLSYGSESPESMYTTITHYLAPLLVGKSATSINLLNSLVNSATKGNYIARSGVETALLDAHGKRLGLPVSALLGGAQTRHLPVLWTLASGDTKRDIAEAQQHISAHCHNTFKLKIGARSLNEDIRHVSAIKAALGDDISIRVDVNQAWDEPTAIKGIAALEEAGIDAIEQPLPGHDISGLVRLANRFAVPMLADESMHHSLDVLNFARAGFHGGVALKIAKSGGPWSVLAMARLAQTAGYALYGGTMLEGSIGTAAALHGWAALGTPGLGTEMFGPLLLRDDIVSEPLNYAEFGVQVPQGPGLGITLDESKLAFYTRGARKSAAV